MKLNERLKNIKLFFNIEKELQMELLQLEEIKQKITENKDDLKGIEEEIIKKKLELQSLKTEAIELKDFINSNFKDEFKDYDYKVNITDCYIISINGKKYISLRNHKTNKSDWYTIATGFYNVETYRYYDALNLDKNGKYKYLYEYKYGYFDNRSYYSGKRFTNEKPNYEVHILEIYPELSIFVDNYVPNTYLEKIYYEVNDLGGKNLIKKNDIRMS